MSAFIVEDSVINRVVSFIATAKNEDAAREIIHKETDCDIRTREGRAALGKMMFDLNCNAVEQRYGAGEAASFRELNYTYAPSARLTTPVQAYKSLQCWLYQCSEGDVPDSSLLFATMTKVGDALAHSIVIGFGGLRQGGMVDTRGGFARPTNRRMNMSKRTLTATVTIVEHDDDTVSIQIHTGKDLATRKDHISTFDASIEIGATFFELATGE